MGRENIPESGPKNTICSGTNKELSRTPAVSVRVVVPGAEGARARSGRPPCTFCLKRMYFVIKAMGISWRLLWRGVLWLHFCEEKEPQEIV